MRVEIDIFSGRRNPTFHLQESEKEIVLRFVKLDKDCVAKERDEVPQLGYRGMRITGTTEGEPSYYVKRHSVLELFLGNLSKETVKEINWELLMKDIRG